MKGRKIINLESKFPYLTTDVPLEQSKNDIKALLRKFKCEEILDYESGENVRIAFKKQGIPYIIDFPVIYVEGKKTKMRPAPQIAGRIVYNKIKAVLADLTLEESDEFMQAMLRFIGIPTPQGMISLGELVEMQKDKIIKGQIEFDPQKIKLITEGRE